MNCNEIKALLSKYIDSRLSASIQNEIAEHLKICPDCADFHQKMLNLNKMAEGLILGGTEEYWQGRKDAIIDRLDDAEPEKAAGTRIGGKVEFLLRLAAIAASITLITYVSIHESRENRRLEGIYPFQAVSPELSKPSTSPTSQYAQAPILPSIGSDSVAVKGTGTQKGKSARPLPKQPPPVVTDRESNLPSATIESKVAVQTNAAPMESEEIPAEKSAIPMKPVEEKKSGDLYLQKEGPAPKDQAMIDKLSPSFAPINESKSAAPKMELSKKAMAETESSAIEAYMEWRRKAEFLEARYGNLASFHYQEGIAKGRTALPADSLKDVLMSMAEAYYNIGSLSREKTEQSNMLNKLQSLASIADSASVLTIDKYIAALKDLIK